MTKSRWRFAACGLLAIAMVANNASAVTSCNPTITLNNGADATDDYTTSSSVNPCILITGNGVSDFNGHTVTSTAGSCAQGIQFGTLTGIPTVREAVIEGSFKQGIDAGLATATERSVAEENRIVGGSTGTFGAAIVDVDVIQNNVILANGYSSAIFWNPDDNISTGVTSKRGTL